MDARGCREAIIFALDSLRARHGREEFRLSEIVVEVLANTAAFQDSTIRTHVTSRMCVNAPEHHATRYDDLERVRTGWYRLYK
jgi:hypothetical protein